jgi:hypothetical protein
MILILLILTNLLLYYRTLSYQGICDDIPVSTGPTVIPKGRWMFFWYHLQGRKYVSWKLAHAQALAIHTINSCLIYLAFGSNTFSAMAAFLFAVNPVNNQCSIWLSGKGYAQNTTCALLMWMFPYASPIFYLYGTYYCGHSLLLFPLIFLFTKYWWLSALVIIGILREHPRLFDKRPGSKFTTESNSELTLIAPRKLIPWFKTVGYHFINSIIALRLGFYHKFMFLHGVSKETNKESYHIDKYFFFGIIIVASILITRNIYLIWWLLCISQWCNMMSFNQTVANRYIYLPNVGLFLFVASILVFYPLGFAVLITYYITRLIQFHVFYKSEYWAIEYSCFESPDFFYSWQNRAIHCFQSGNYHGALGNMIKADELRPNDWKITYNMCQIYLLIGHLATAKVWYKKAGECNIDGREKEINRLMERLGKWIESIETQAKSNDNKVNLDLGKFDMQR